MTSARIGFSLLAALLLAACGHDHSHGDCEGHSHDPMCLQCDGDEDTFDASRDGEDGNFTVELVGGEPDPHLVGNNVLTLRVLDAAGAPVDGVSFDLIEPFTPQGGHSTPLEAKAMATGNPGEYELTDVNYLHMGIWELRLELSAGGQSDRVVFTFCIDEV